MRHRHEPPVHGNLVWKAKDKYWTAPWIGRKGHLLIITLYPNGSFHLASRGSSFGVYDSLDSAKTAAEAVVRAHRTR